ncbi:MAG: hypothetical protein GQ532_07515 [Methylomarinum sp.]|nr:hypothetical protein [Methylomarinum sp.]
MNKVLISSWLSAGEEGRSIFEFLGVYDSRLQVGLVLYTLWYTRVLEVVLFLT